MIRSALIYMVSFLICHGIIILPVELEPNVFFSRLYQNLSTYIYIYNYGLSQYYQELDPLSWGLGGGYGRGVYELII